jgi:hypothetical protein
MATLGSNVLTYADWAKRLDANGRVDKIVEILNQWNEILDDMLVKETNDGTGHKTTVRTGIPTATWRMLNYGVPNMKSTTAQVRDTCGMLEGYAECDKTLADMSGNQKEFRLSEAAAIMEGMSQQMAQTLFYGNTASNPERFLGLAPRFNSLSAASGANIIDWGGTGTTNTSVWLVCWGDVTCHALFPKSSKAGLSHQDLGEQTLFDAVNNKYQGYRDHFKWDLGLSVRDWRYVARVANIETNVSTGVGANATNRTKLIQSMIDATERLPTLGVGKAAFYVNRPIRSILRGAILDKAANQLTWENFSGKRVAMFDGIPIRRVDQLVSTEARVV